MKFSYSQTSFKSGRLSPKLVQRIDTEQYKDGCSILEGMKVLPEGGAERVKGTRVIGVDNLLSLPAGFGAGPRAIHQFSLLIGTTPVLFQIYESFPAGSDVGGQVMLYGYKFTGYTLTSIGSILLSNIVTSRYDAGLFDYAYVDGTLVLTHFTGDIPPIYITINKTTPNLTTATSNSMAYLLGTPSPFPSDYRRWPMSDIGATSTTLTLAASTGQYITLTGTTADIAKMKIGGWIYLEGLGSHNFGDGVARNFVASGWHYVDSFPTSTSAKVLCNTSVAGQNPLIWATVSSVTLWAYSLWGASGEWPRTVCTHEGRIVFGGTRSNPLTVYGSRTNQPNQFNQLRLPNTGTELLTYTGLNVGDTIATDPYVFTMSSDEDSRIHFLKSMGSLVIGTDRKEWVAHGGDVGILSALSVNFKPQSTQGSLPLSAVSAGKGIYYLSNNGHKIFSFRYSEANGSLMSIETSLLMSDILEEDPAVELCWAAHIQSVLVRLKSGRVVAIMDTGSEKGMAVYDTNLLAISALAYIDTGVADTTYARGQCVALYSATFGNLAWEQTYYEFGLDNSFITKLGTTEANAYLFLDNVLKVTTNSTGGKRSLYNGTTDFAQDTGGFILVPKALYPDGKMIFVNFSTKQTVSFTATTWQADDFDSLGQFWIITDTTINTWTSFLVGKLVSPCKVATMNIEAGQQWGSAQMGVKNIDTIGIRHYKTYSYEISSDNVNWQEVVVADTVGQATNGREDRKFTSSPRYDQVVYLRNTKAEPCTILGINMRGVSNDG